MLTENNAFIVYVANFHRVFLCSKMASRHQFSVEEYTVNWHWCSSDTENVTSDDKRTVDEVDINDKQ